MVTSIAAQRGEGPTIVYINDAFAEITGLTEAEAIGATPSIIQGPKTPAYALTRIQGAFDLQLPIREVVCNETRSGSEYWLELNIIPLPDESGRITHFALIGRDLTDLRESEQALRVAAVIDADGSYLGSYRKSHIPQLVGYNEKLFFKPGDLGYPVFETAYCRLGVYICYDRHFPEGWRALALAGAELVINPSATTRCLSDHLWELEQPAAAVANGIFIGTINRVGTEPPWNRGQFYGGSYFATPRGEIVAQAPYDDDGLVVADLDLDQIRRTRDTWQFYRECRPDTYGSLGT